MLALSPWAWSSMCFTNLMIKCILDFSSNHSMISHLTQTHAVLRSGRNWSHCHVPQIISQWWVPCSFIILQLFAWQNMKGCTWSSTKLWYSVTFKWCSFGTEGVSHVSGNHFTTPLQHITLHITPNPGFDTQYAAAQLVCKGVVSSLFSHPGVLNQVPRALVLGRRGTYSMWPHAAVV